jgi:hypothetical protein
VKAARRVRREAAPEKARITRMRDLAAQPTLLDSAANHGIGTLDAISAALAGKPWLPPLPALA